MTLNTKVRELEDSLLVDMEAFMDVYKDGLQFIDIAERLDISLVTVYKVTDTLNLPEKKKKRAEAYVKYIIELNMSPDENGDVSATTTEDYVTHKLSIASRALQRSRDENNFLRSQIREETRKAATDERALDLIHTISKGYEPHDIHIHTHHVDSEYYKEYTSCLLLSDIHAEEVVSSKDVGLNNEYNWDIMTDRLDYLFETWLNSYRGEDNGKLFILGDVISGIIHNSLENTSKPTAEALAELAKTISSWVATLASVFISFDIYFVSGNHERLSEKIKAANKGFDFGYLFAQILKAQVGLYPNVTMNISTTGLVTAKVGDKVIGGHHGDQFRGSHTDNRTHTIQKAFKSTLDADVDHIFQGHTHRFMVTNTDTGVSVCNASVIGVNAYGHVSGWSKIRPSQTIVTFDPKGECENIQQVYLDL
jgi:predicted phosphodiesterase